MHDCSNIHNRSFKLRPAKFNLRLTTLLTLKHWAQVNKTRSFGNKTAGLLMIESDSIRV
jgi:hypothetical protein